MAVETVTYVGDLDPTNPSGSAPKSEGDDHLRNIKSGLKNSFVGYSGAIIATGTDGGAANVYTLTPATALVAYSSKMMVVFCPVVDNTGAATLNISGLGAKPIVSVAGVPLVAGDLTGGRYYTAFYDGTKFRLDNVTQNYVDQLVISGTVPGVSNPANADKFFHTDGTAGGWASVDLRGEPTKDKGNTGTTAQVIAYTDGEGQTLTATGNHSLSTTGWPTGRVAGMLLHLVNYGAYSITTTGITWIKSDGSETTNFATSGITLSATGRSRVILYSFGDGVVYGRAA
jgi:hypothetical protein